MPVLADKDRVTHPDDTAFFRDNDAIKLAGSTRRRPTSEGCGAHTFASDPGDTSGTKRMNLPSISAYSSYFDLGSTRSKNVGDIIAGQVPTHQPR